MVWFKVDDSFNQHPKVLAAGIGAVGLWTLAGSWSSANLTNGFVPDHVLARLTADGPALAQELALVGLWKRTRGGYLFHDWADYNPNSEAVKRERDEARKRMRNLRKKRRSNPESPDQTANCSAEHDPNVRANLSERSADVRDPVPVPEGSSNEEPSSPPKRRGGRTDPDFEKFYEIYPKHTGRLAAEAAWKKAIRRAPPATIIAGAERYAAERAGQEAQFTKGPAPWLNQGCWDDEPQPPRNGYRPYRNPANQDIYDEDIV